MSHGPESLSQNGGNGSNGGPATQTILNPPEGLTPFLRLLKREEDQLLSGATELALARLPVYVQTDEYRYRMGQDASLTEEQNERALCLNESRKISMLGRNVPLEFIIARHVIEAIPEEQQTVQRGLLARYNSSSFFNITIRCIDMAGGIGEDHCNYTFLKGGMESLYVCGRDMNGKSVEEYYDFAHPEGHEKISQYKQLYTRLGERALSVEDTTSYLRDVASRQRVVHIV